MRKILVAVVAALSLGSSVAAADIQLGALAPDFTKSVLGGGSLTLSQYEPGKVVVLFLLGYN